MSLYQTLSRLAIAVVLLAWTYPYLQGRQQALILLLKNKPEKLPEVNSFSSYSHKLINKVRNCEDGLIVEEEALAILSCDPGRDLWNTVMGTFYPKRSLIPNGQLWIYRYDLPDDSEKALAPIELVDYPGEFSFHPLGVEYDRDTSTLFVCNHHLAGSRVDLFTLDLSANKPVARHTQTILHPLIRTPNSIIALNEKEFYVTNDHYIRRKDFALGALAETYLGLPGGTVAHVNLAAEPPAVRTVARVPFANGVTLLNDSTVAVASSSAAEIRLYKRLDNGSLEQSGIIKVPFLPDNLSTDGDGVLLIAGHPHPPTLDKLVHHRRSCVSEDGVVPQECWKSTAPTWVSKWTAEKGLEDLYVSSREFGSACTAAKDATRNVGIVTGLYENGILVWGE
ncbi:uncharacterized protein BJX67DRAFT_343782 [Aspergillus lucknowensis]|uniref:Calcium-dependent phosphotriesterase n=1 Tax=Aspergillus lucknowensis TaxID=176173 RepID=A0ABR4M3P9_9EURO